MKKSNLFLLLMILCLCLSACSDSSATEASTEPTYSQEELAYNAKMAEYLDAVDPSQVSGNKAVVVLVDSLDSSDYFYTSKYLPEELVAESPEEVRYIIWCYEGAFEVGRYTNGAYAYQYGLSASLNDLKNGENIHLASVYGGEPPEEVSEYGEYYGSRPDIDELGSKITEVIVDQIKEYEKRFCVYCGYELEEQFISCPECGTFR